MKPKKLHRLTELQRLQHKLDAHFDAKHEVWHTTPAAGQRQGIDRYFVNRITGCRFGVNYRVDKMAHETGKALIEVLPGADGYEPASRAQVVVYYMPEREAYIIKMASIRSLLPRWSIAYPLSELDRHPYATHKILIPLSELAQIADQVMEIR